MVLHAFSEGEYSNLPTKTHLPEQARSYHPQGRYINVANNNIGNRTLLSFPPYYTAL